LLLPSPKNFFLRLAPKDVLRGADTGDDLPDVSPTKPAVPCALDTGGRAGDVLSDSVPDASDRRGDGGLNTEDVDEFVLTGIRGDLLLRADVD